MSGEEVKEVKEVNEDTEPKERAGRSIGRMVHIEFGRSSNTSRKCGLATSAGLSLWGLRQKAEVRESDIGPGCGIQRLYVPPLILPFTDRSFGVTFDNGFQNLATCAAFGCGVEAGFVLVVPVTDGGS